MRSTILSKCLVVGLAVGSVAMVVAIAPSKAKEQSNSEVLICKSYNVADLAVWRQAGKPGEPSQEFDPSVLIALIKSVVSSEAQADLINPFPKNASLVIAQTQANHKRISELLESLRPQLPNEEVEQLHPAP